MPESVRANLGEFVRIVGDGRIGEGAVIGTRTAIRADEGTPILIGAGAQMGERVTFHALKGTEITVGDGLVAGNETVLHGPLEVGNNLNVADRGVVFRVRVDDNVTVGEGAVIAGPANEAGELELEIPGGANIPAGAVITDQEQLDAVLEGRAPASPETTTRERTDQERTEQERTQ